MVDVFVADWLRILREPTYEMEMIRQKMMAREEEFREQAAAEYDARIRAAEGGVHVEGKFCLWAPPNDNGAKQ